MAKDNHLGVDLATEFTHEEVAQRIVDYFGSSEVTRVDIGAVTRIVREFFKLKNQEERMVVVSALGAFFCTDCGSGYLPCYCCRDD